MCLRLTRLTTSLLQILLLLGSASQVAGQGSTGAIDGVALSEEDGGPIPFALIRLVPVDSNAAPRQGITDAGGRFRLVDVTPGDHHLHLLRIGYRPVVSPVLHVRAGETLRHELRGVTQAVQLATVTVRAAPSCLDATQLASDARLTTLWNEARKGVEIRRGFELQYRFMRILRQDIEIRWRFKTARQVRLDTLVSEPDSVLKRDERAAAKRRAQGYAEGGLLVVPNEKELLDEAFLEHHCLETSTAESEGAVGLRFRPIHARRDGVDVRGTIWVEAHSYQIERLELEHLRGDRVVGRIRIDYGDVAVGESALRLPSGGSGSVSARGVPRMLVSGARARLTYSYRDFAQVGPR